MRSIRLALLLIAATALCACATSRFIGYELNPDGPGYAGVVSLTGLDGNVSIVFDEHAVPHILAQSQHDLVFGLGYVHARERLFQMDVLRRVAYGRLAELFGNNSGEAKGLFKDTLATDRFFKVMGIGRTGDRLAKELPAESRALIEAYTTGVNAYIYTGLAPIEHRILGVVPELWTPGNVMAVARLNAWDLSLNMPEELIRYMLRVTLGEERQKEIFPTIEHPGPYVIERADHDYRTSVPGPAAQVREPPAPGAEWADTARAVLSAVAGVRQNLEPLAPADASNNWVIGPKHTASGKPILANDPHLSHQAPGTMYLVHMRGPDVDVMGVTLPGTPAIVLGHNRHFAWGATTTFADVQDIYLEKADPADPKKYLTPTGSEPYRCEKADLIERNDSAMIPHRFDVRYTRHGPVLNDAVEPGMLPRDAGIMAIKWTLDEFADDFDVMWKVARATSVEDFRKAMTGWAVPIMNWVVADDQGHIGYFPAGKVPKRKGWDGTVPVPGWTGEFEWDGFIPMEQLPQLWDPPSGRIVTANNKVVPPGDYPWPFTLDAATSYRAARITEVIDSKEKWTADGVRQLQTDVRLKQADRLLPVLLEALKGATLDEREQAALAALTSWDHVADVRSIGMTVYWATYRTAWELALNDDLSPFVIGLISTFQYSYGFFDRLWAEVPDAKVWDLKGTPEVEGRDAILRLAFKKGVARLADNYGRDVADWRWGRVHTIEFKHPFGASDMTRPTFNVGPEPIPGIRDTVWNAAGKFWDEDFVYQVEHGPVFRHVIDFGAPDDGGMVIDCGNSGWPATKHYRDGFDDWKAGRLWKVKWEPEEFRPKSIGTITLVPAK